MIARFARGLGPSENVFLNLYLNSENPINPSSILLHSRFVWQFPLLWGILHGNPMEKIGLVLFCYNMCKCRNLSGIIIRVLLPMGELNNRYVR